MSWLSPYVTWFKVAFLALLGAAALFFRGQAAEARRKLAETGKVAAERRAACLAKANKAQAQARAEANEEVERAIDHANDPGARRDFFE